MDNELMRFTKAHQEYYEQALTEIRNGRKSTHWMWFIFPQLKELGHSPNALYYGIKDLNEAKDFLNDKYLGGNLLEISAALLALESNDINYIMGSPDDMKLRSCMTLFSAAAPQEKVFTEVLEKYFGGKADNITQNILKAAADS